LAQINIIFSRFSAFYTPLIATKSAGFLEQEGLEPSFTNASPGKSARQALDDGSAHVAQSAVSASWGTLEKGERSNIVHFAQINERDGFLIAAREPDPDFTWDKLSGRKVMASGSGQPFAMFRYALDKMGVDCEQVDVVDAGGADAIDAAFRAGQGDYVLQQGPAPQQLEKDGLGYIVANVGEVIGPVAFSSLCALRDWLESDMAKAFMRAYRKARQYVNEAPAGEIAAAQAHLFEGIDRGVLTETIAFYQRLGCWNPEVAIRRDIYEVSLDVFLYSGRITRRHPYGEVVVAPLGEA
jgi:NitT/TauT family transport system substrate-binding protein